MGVLVSKRLVRSFYWNITSKGDEHDGEIKNVLGGCAACCSYIRNERRGAATTISQHLLQGRDAEQMEALQRQAGFYEIIAVPKTSARIDKEFYICPREDFESLVIDDFSNPCPFCELEGKEVRKCGRRRALIRCGVVGNTDGECPYKGV